MSRLIVSIDGLTLTETEKRIIEHPACFGVVLYPRNYENKAQLRELTVAIQSVDRDCLIFADQEGGKVQALQHDFTSLPASAAWGQAYSKNKLQTKTDFTMAISQMAHELREVGVDASFVPVLDVDQGVSQLIGDRSFSRSSEVVVALGEVMVNALHMHGLPAVGKHFPGHGAVAEDSYRELPHDGRSWEEISMVDLLPYRQLNAKLDAVMTAHIVYEEVDWRPATFSSHWLKDILRGHFKFDGLIIAADLAMESAVNMGSFVMRAQLAIEAGCDLLLVCHNADAVIEILDTVKVSRTDTELERRLARFRARCYLGDTCSIS